MIILILLFAYFSSMLLIRNHMIFLAQFGINKFEKIYSYLVIPNCTRNHVITYANYLRML